MPFLPEENQDREHEWTFAIAANEDSTIYARCCLRCGYVETASGGRWAPSVEAPEDDRPIDTQFMYCHYAPSL